MSDDNLDEKATENIRALLDQLRRTTVRLVEYVPPATLPQRMASGFVIGREGRHFVISVAHAISSGNWWLELDANRDGSPGAVLVPLKTTWAVLRHFTLPGERMDVDLAWASVDLEHLRAEVAKDPCLRGADIRLQEYLGPLDCDPTPEEPYAFCASNQAIAGLLPTGGMWLERLLCFEVGMEYVGVDSGDGTHRFQLARKHQGHSYYKGSSGAPIADPTGKIVSVVVGGEELAGQIRGAHLADYSRLIGRLT